MKHEMRYEVSCDPYDNGARLQWIVSAGNARAARRKARFQAEIEGVMRAGWRNVECRRIGFAESKS